MLAEVSWGECAQLPVQSVIIHWVLLNKPAVHMNFSDLFRKPQIYQEHCIIQQLPRPHAHTHTHTFGPDIKNTITIFHHLWQAFESADKPWLHYYCRSDKQSNIF